MSEISNTLGPLNTAVLFLVFNRPNTTSQVFEAIRQAKPPRLYVAADGPRDGREGETERVARVREIATAVDWPCEVKTLFRDQNQGCKYAVSGAITWFFEQEEQGIILEDDCLPSQSFFWFCQEMLDRYKDDARIMSITGTNVTKGIEFNSSYFFSIYALMWGWATWAQSWEKYELEMDSWTGLNHNVFFSELYDSSLPFRSNWKKKLERTYCNEIDTWDYQWIYSCWRNNGMTVAPSKNLIRNLGYSADATHTTSNHPILSNLRFKELNWPLEGPISVTPHKKADTFISKHWFGISSKNFLKSLILNIPGVTVMNNFRKSFL